MIPKELSYTKTHEWARIEGQQAVVGITHFAQEQLGDITYVELPLPGAKVTQGLEMGSIESVKAASDLYSPVTGEVVAVNQDLEANPELLNQDPFGRGWLLKVSLSETPKGLLGPDQYAEIAKADH